jgi:ribonuclease D
MAMTRWPDLCLVQVVAGEGDEIVPGVEVRTVPTRTTSSISALAEANLATGA